MAQLKDTNIDGTLNVSSNIVLQTGMNILGIHPETGGEQSLISMSSNGNTIVGYHGYANQNGNSHIYGNNVLFCVASAGNASFRPYYREGDSLELDIYTSGFVTNSGKDVYFYMPFSKPIIGSPTVTITSNNGMVIRQNDKYLFGSSATAYATPTSYSKVGDTDWNGICIKAVFGNNTNVTNNSPVGIRWSGVITFS